MLRFFHKAQYLQLLESLNLVLVVGLAVDYCVHLAEGYSRSTHHDRLGRIRDALTEVGISVLSGCVTTLGASAFMLLSVILFFEQFGTFLFATLGFAFVYSLILFPTVLGIIGPENETGLLPCFKKNDDEYPLKGKLSHTISVASAASLASKGSVASKQSVASKGSMASVASAANKADVVSVASVANKADVVSKASVASKAGLTRTASKASAASKASEGSNV